MNRILRHSLLWGLLALLLCSSWQLPAQAARGSRFVEAESLLQSSCTLDPGPDVQTLIVTSEQPLTLDCPIQISGDADVILLSPAGITLGPHTSLQMKGSLLLTSAEKLVEDQHTVEGSTLLDLQFGKDPGLIRIEGEGHVLENAFQVMYPYGRPATQGLQVAPGHTLAVIGGEVDLEGAVLTAEGGRIELAALGSGQATLSSQPMGWSLNPVEAASMRDLHLSQEASLDVSISDLNLPQVSSGIYLQGADVTFEDGSTALIQNRGERLGGSIDIQATGKVSLYGETHSDDLVSSSLIIDNFESGPGGDIRVQATDLSLDQGARLDNRTFGPGSGGQVIVEVLNRTDMQGTTSNPAVVTNISTNAFGSGSAGEVKVSSKTLDLNAGAIIGSGNFRGSGNAGDITIHAEEINLVGINSTASVPSGIASVSVDQGDCGRVTVKTARLRLIKGGRLASGSVADGNTQTLQIEATEFIELRGVATLENQVIPELNALVGSAAVTFPQASREAYGFPEFPSGNSGEVIIRTPQLIVAEGAEVSGRNDGPGQGGDIQIMADAIFLTDGGKIATNVASGQGGDIDLTTGTLWLRPSRSQITTRSAGEGDGGNIRIIAGTLVAEEGGLIETTSQGSGDAGNVLVAADHVALKRNSGLVAISEGQGTGGDISLATGTLQLEQTGRVIVSSLQQGTAGNVRIKAESVFLSDNSGLQAFSRSEGPAGNIRIDTNTLLSEDSRIDTLNKGPGEAGDIQIDAQSAVVLENSSLDARSQQQVVSGKIAIHTPVLIQDKSSQILGAAD